MEGYLSRNPFDKNEVLTLQAVWPPGKGEHKVSKAALQVAPTDVR